MATEVKIPAMGESISSGILAAWHVKDGDYVEKDQVLYELETDKVTSEGNAEVSGIISLKVAVDDEVDIGQVVATIDESAAKPADTGKRQDQDTSAKADAPAEDDKAAKTDTNAASEKENTAKESGTSALTCLSKGSRRNRNQPIDP